MMRLRSTMSVVLVAGITTVLAGGPMAPDELILPARFRATVMVLNTLPPGSVTAEIGGDAVAVGPDGAAAARIPPPAGAVPSAHGNRPTGSSAFLRIAIDRWSTGEEQAALIQALKSGGDDALVAEMEKMTVGYLQVNGDLRWPIRLASTWKTEEGRVVRLATNGPILFPKSASRTLGTDDTIGIVEFTVPPTGRGQGSLVAATRAGFDDRGRIESIAMAMNTGVQRLTNVEIETPAVGEGQD